MNIQAKIDIPLIYINLPTDDIEQINDILTSNYIFEYGCHHSENHKSQDTVYIFTTNPITIEKITCVKCINFAIDTLSCAGNKYIIYNVNNNNIKLIDHSGSIYVGYIPNFVLSAWKTLEQDPTDYKAMKILKNYYKNV